MANEDYLKYCKSLRTFPAVQAPLSPAAQEAKYKTLLGIDTADTQRKTEQIMASLDLQALRGAASKLQGQRDAGIYHIAHGGFNQVFIVTFEDGSDLIARVSGSHTRQDDEVTPEAVAHRIESEGATISLLHRRTSIPVPQILSVVSDASNPVHAPYTLQSRIIGRPLHEIWPILDIPPDSQLSAEQMEAVVRQVAHMEGQLMQTKFDAIGSLLRDKKDGDISVARMGISRAHFYPLVDDVGPWQTSRAYIQACIRSQLNRLEGHPQEWIRHRLAANFSDSEDQAREHLDFFTRWYALLEEAMDTLDLSEFDPPRYPFVLVHDDLEMGNIMVANEDPSRVVGVVDWEGARVVPLWASHFANWFLGKGMYVGEDPELLDRLLEIRKKIHVSMQPAIEGIEEATDGLRALWHIANRPSMFHNPPNVLGAIEHFLNSRPQEDACLFDRVIRLGYNYVENVHNDE